MGTQVATPNLNSIQEPEIPKNDERAKLEVESFAKDHNRDHNLKDHFNKALICFIWFCCIMFIVVLMCRGILLFFPEGWIWLPEKRLDKIDNLIKIVLSGGIGTFIGGYLKGKL